MKKILVFILIFFSACNIDKHQISLYGKWTTANVTDHTGLEISDEIIYFENGSYEGKIFSKNDSVIESFSGQFNFRETDSIIEMQTDEKSFEHKLIRMTKDELVVRNPNGNLVRMVRID